MKPLPRPAQDGWTLIEVLVAFAILALAVIAAFEVYANGFRRLAIVRDQTDTIAQARLVFERVSESIDLIPGTSRMESAEGKEWRVMTELLAEDNALGPAPVRIRIWQENDRDGAAPVIDTIILRKISRP